MKWQGNPRTTALLAVAKANNLKLDIEHTEPAKGVSDDYRKLNKLGKVPTFEGSDGYILSECLAIAIYRKSRISGSVGTARGLQAAYPARTLALMNIIHHLQLSLSEDYC